MTIRSVLIPDCKRYLSARPTHWNSFEVYIQNAVMATKFFNWVNNFSHRFAYCLNSPCFFASNNQRTPRNYSILRFLFQFVLILSATLNMDRWHACNGDGGRKTRNIAVERSKAEVRWRHANENRKTPKLMTTNIIIDVCSALYLRLKIWWTAATVVINEA